MKYNHFLKGKTQSFLHFWWKQKLTMSNKISHCFFIGKPTHTHGSLRLESGDNEARGML